MKLWQIVAMALLLPVGAGAAPTVIIGAEDDAAPWSYADGTGYVNDLVRAAFEAVDWQVKFVVVPYARCKMMAQRGELAACFSTSKTPETEPLFLFPELPVFVARNVLFANADSALQGCDLAAWGRKISVGFVTAYEYAQPVVELRKSQQIASVQVGSEIQLLRMLRLRRFDGALVTVDPVRRIELVARLADVPALFKPVCDFGGEPAYLAFSRRNKTAPAALTAFNKGMALLTRNGAIKRLEAHWAQHALKLEAAKKH